MTDFKKAMFEKRIEKLDELKPVSITWKGQSVQIDNFEKINQLMSQAVEDDLKNVQEVPGGWNNMRAEATQDEQLKKAIFIAYINDTDDFKESIYNEKAQVKKYTVSFDKNATDATGTMAAQEFEHGKEQVLSKNQFERIGYDFIGWKDINGNIYTDQQMVNNLVAENDGQITLFAQWKPIEYQVKFHKNHSNAVGTMENQKMVYDQSYQLNKNEFTLDGYEFKGWATSPNGQVVYKDEEIVTKLTDKSNHIIDLYSIWEKKPTPQPPAVNKAPVIVATDKDGASTVKTITVTVKAKDIVDKPDDDTSKPDVPNDGTSKPYVPNDGTSKPDVPNDGTSKPNKPNINPQTGDVASVGLLQSIIVGSTSILALLLGNRKKRKR